MRDAKVNAESLAQEFEESGNINLPVQEPESSE
jgi:hypothetical protein